MALVDQMVLGGDILPLSNFNTQGGFESNASDPDLFQTDTSRESRQGQFGIGFYAQGIDVGWSYSQWGPAQINGEQQHYINLYNPNPSNYQPYFTRNGKIVVSSRPTTAAEKNQYYIKGYYLIPGGQQAQANWFTSANGFPGGIPSEWEPSNEGWDSGGTGNTGGVILFDKLPANYLAGMIHLYGRYAQSFGRFIVRGKCDAGGRGMSESDIRLVQAMFAALMWGLEDIPYRHDMNGNAITGATEMPSQPNADGILEEIDPMESFSENIRIAHQTLHWHSLTQKLQDAAGMALTFDLDAESHTWGWDSIANPAGGGKIGFIIDDKYSRILSMPDTFRKQMVTYEPDPTATYKPKLVNGTGVVTGLQVHPDGSPRFRKFTMIANMARDSKLVRDAIRTYGPAADVPPYKDVGELEIEYIRAYPQAVENPDTWGVTRLGVLQRTENTGSSAQGISTAYRPTLGQGIRFSQGLVAGQHKYELQDPTLADTGTFIFDDYGADATLVSGERGPTLILDVAPVAVDTPRRVRFELDP